MVAIMKFFQMEMPTPTLFGWFHIMYILLAIAGSVLLVVFGRNMSEKKYKLTLLIAWISLLVLEVFKLLTFSIDWDLSGTVLKFKSYAWYTFPFQMCATPMFVLPFVIFAKNKKIADACTAYMVSFSFFAGLVTFIYPGDVFISRMWIDIQSMTYHGLMIVLGIFIAAYRRKDLTIKFFIGALFPFTILITLAVLLNEVMFFAVPDIRSGAHTFNMFFISTHYDSTLPVLSMLNGKIDRVARIFLYYFCFMAIAYIIYMITYACAVLLPKAFASLSRKKKVATEAE